MEKKVENKNHEALTKEIAQVVEEIVEEPTTETPDDKNATVGMLEDGQVMIEDKLYGLVMNYRQGFDPNELAKRYSDVLARYDYIVGDWGFEQLRLKGFFDNDNKKALPDQKIATLQDYIYEYCNFGCRYFVLEKVHKKKEKPTTNKRKRRPKKQEAFVEENVRPMKKNKPVIHRKRKEESYPKHKETRPGQESGSFTIRKRED